MRYFKKILIPTDGCNYAKAGVLQGLRIAKFIGAFPIVVVPIDEASFFADECECHSTDACDRITEEVKEAAKSIELDIKVMSKKGDSKKVVQKLIKKDEEINLLCMGMKHSKDAKDVFLGTLHEHLLANSHIPIIIQPYSIKAYLPKFNALQTGEVMPGVHKLTILVAMDGSEQSEVAAWEAIQFANQLNLGTRVVALHVTKSLKDANGKEKIKAADFMGIPEKAKKMGLDMGIVVEPEVRIGTDMAGEIIKRGAELKADLIVMGSHGKTGPLARFLGSKTETVLRTVPVPVMIVPPELRRTTKDVCAEEFMDEAWDEMKK
jgi:nucleotide-binding universal stress UspA family protein